jgi:hypothetical protein
MHLYHIGPSKLMGSEKSQNASHYFIPTNFGLEGNASYQSVPLKTILSQCSITFIMLEGNMFYIYTLFHQI